MEVATYRYNRQKAMTKDGKKGWFLIISRWLPHRESQSNIQGFGPAFASVQRRAESAFQRRKKLEAEDRLLRSILLSQEEVKDAEPLELSIL